METPVNLAPSLNGAWNRIFDFCFLWLIHKQIKEQLNAETVIVKDAYGDGRHVRLACCITLFSYKGVLFFQVNVS